MKAMKSFIGKFKKVGATDNDPLHCGVPETVRINDNKVKLAGLFFACLLIGGIVNNPCHAQPGFGKTTKINTGWSR